MTDPKSWKLDDRGQAAVYMLYLMLPLVLLAGIIYNTGDLADQRIEAQNATDAAARSGAIWVARTLNFNSAANCMHTKITSLIALLKGCATAAKWIWITFIAAAAVNTAITAGYIAACVASLGTSPTCSKIGDAVKCTSETYQGVSSWNTEKNNWESRRDTWVPKLEQARKAIATVQKSLKLAVPAFMAIDVAAYYRWNRKTNTPGFAAIVSDMIPTSYLDMLQERSIGYVCGPSFVVMGDPSGPDRDAARRDGALCVGPAPGDNYSPASGTEKYHWAGMSKYEGYMYCFGPFELWRLAASALFLKSKCIFVPGSIPSVPVQVAEYFFFTEYEHKQQADFLNDEFDAGRLKTYLLKGTPEEKPPSLLRSGDENSWDEAADKGEKWTYKWGADRKVVGFDFVVAGFTSAKNLRLWGGQSALWGRSLEQEAFGKQDFLGFWPSRDMLTVSQTRVYNGTNVDLFTQDWRVTSVPVSLKKIQFLSWLDSLMGWAMNH